MSSTLVVTLVLLAAAPSQDVEPTVIYGWAVTDAGDSTFVRLELDGSPERPEARLAEFGRVPLPFDSVSFAPDTSTIAWLWPGRAHDRCELRRRAAYHWTGACRSRAAERRIVLGGGYVPDLGQDLRPSRTDVRIVDRARDLLRTETDWNRADDRFCADDERSGRVSLFCALYLASIEVAGDYLHRRPAMNVPREIIGERAVDRVTVHTLRDFNNHELTSFEEIHDVFEEAYRRVAAAATGSSPDTRTAGGHTCLVLPGSWSNETRSFRIGRGDELGRLAYVSQVDGGAWHQRAAVHPTGPYAYVAATIEDGDPPEEGPAVFVHALDRHSCELGPRLQVVWPAPAADASSEPSSRTRRRYYGLEMHPSGRFLYQTTEAWREIRLFQVGEEGLLTFVEAYDVTRDGRHVCDHARRLEIHTSGRTLYSNCNNDGAGDGVDHALQAWRIAEDGRLSFLQHHVTGGMDAGVFDPTMHPNGRWLYQPVASGKSTAPEGRGAYVLVYHVGRDGQLRHHSSVRVEDPDEDVAGSEAAPQPAAEDLPFTAFPSTVLVHPDGTHAYVTLHDQVNFEHRLLTYRIDPSGGDLSVVSSTDTATRGTGNHHGGVLATRGGRTFLYTFLNVFPGPEGFLEQYEIGPDHRPVPLEPNRVPSGLVDARHPVVVPVAEPAADRGAAGSPSEALPELTCRRLEAGRRFESEIAKGEAHCYRLELEEGDFALVLAEHLSTWFPNNLLIRRISPDGDTAAHKTNRQIVPEVASFVAPESGTYRFEVTRLTHRQGVDVGPYAIWVEAILKPDERRARRETLAADRRVRWLSENLAPVRSVDPEDDDYSDLMPLAEALDGVQVVALGEATHGSGAAFLAKTRLVKFLHEVMGFDVLVWESGLYDMRRASEHLKAGGAAREALERGVFGIWLDSDQMRPLVSYLDETARRGSPLELAGVDLQFSGAGSDSAFVADLAAYLSRIGVSTSELAPGERVRHVLRNLIGYRYFQQDPPEEGVREHVLDVLRAWEEEARHDRSVDGTFWARALWNARTYAANVFDRATLRGGEDPSAEEEERVYGLRDRVMGRNLVWLAEELYPDRKLIVWAATGHLLKHPDRIRHARGGDAHPVYERGLAPGSTLGHEAALELGDRLYVLAVTAYGGLNGKDTWIGYPYHLERDQVREFELEELIAATGAEVAYLDLRRSRAGDEWLDRPLVARGIDRYIAWRSAWRENADGLLFVREMTPSTTEGTVDASRDTTRVLQVRSDAMVSPSPDGRILAFVDWATGDLTVTDPTSGDVGRLTRNPAPYEHGFANSPRFAPDGKRVAFTWWNAAAARAELRVVGLDPATLEARGEPRTLRAFDTGWIEAHGWTPDGERVIGWTRAEGGGNQIVLVAAEDGRTDVVRTFEWRVPLAVRPHPGGSYLAYDYQVSGDDVTRDIRLLDLWEGREVEVVTHPANDVVLGWSPDGRHQVFASDRSGAVDAWALVIADGQGRGEPRRVAADLGDAAPVEVAASGHLFYAAVKGGRDVLVAPVDAERRRVAREPSAVGEPGPAERASPAWSADGRRLAWIREVGPRPRATGHQVIAIHTRATGDTRLVSLAPRLSHLGTPRWLDAERLVVAAHDERSNTFGIYTLDVPTGHLSVLVRADPGVAIEEPVPGPEGRTLYFKENREGPDGGRSQRVLRRNHGSGEESTLFQTEPRRRDAWRLQRLALSPDGEHLALTLQRPDAAERLVVLPARGGPSRRVESFPGGGNVALAWAPDGRTLWFTRPASSRANDSRRELWWIDPETGETGAAGLADEQLSGLTFDPSGGRLAFSAGRRSYQIRAIPLTFRTAGDARVPARPDSR